MLALPDGVGPASVMERSTRGTGVSKSPQTEPARNLADVGRERRVPVDAVDVTVSRGTLGWFMGGLPGGHGDVLRGSRGDAAGTKSGSSFIERIAVNTGTVPVPPGSL